MNGKTFRSTTAEVFITIQQHPGFRQPQFKNIQYCVASVIKDNYTEPCKHINAHLLSFPYRWKYHHQYRLHLTFQPTPWIHAAAIFFKLIKKPPTLWIIHSLHSISCFACGNSVRKKCLRQQTPYYLASIPRRPKQWKVSLCPHICSHCLQHRSVMKWNMPVAVIIR